MSTDHKVSKKSPKKELRIFKNKQVVAFGIVATVAIAGIVSGLYLISYFEDSKYPDLNIGTNCGIWLSIDPLNTMVPTDYDIINQVAEGLFEHKMADDNSLLDYNLAISHSWSDDYLNLTCNLRQGVKFHDGTIFDAASVKWNIDRIYNLFNQGSGIPLSIYDWFIPNGTKFIDGSKVANNAMRLINDTKIIDDYTVRFILNKPYIPLPTLLASVHSCILSPTSTPFDTFFPFNASQRSDEGIIGTGPFMFDEYIPLDKIILSSNPSYWDGQPKINKLIFHIYYMDKPGLYGALLSNEVSMLNGYSQIWDTFSDSIYYDDTIDVDSYFNDPSIIIQEGPPIFYFTYLINH